MPEKQYRPGIDLTRTSSEDFTFSRNLCEEVVILMRPSMGDVIDIELELRARPEPREGNFGTPAQSAEKVHLYLDANGAALDLTESFCRQLRGLLDKIPAEDLKRAYETAAGRWLDLAEKVGIDYTPEQIAADRARLQSLIQTTPLSALLQQLGDRTHGLRGNLHIINYLYRDIAPAPVSLRTCIRDAGGDFDALLGQNPRLIISVGKLRWLDQTWSPQTTPPMGGMRIQIAWLSKNLLADDVDKLKQDLETLANQVKTRLLNIHKLVAADGPIQTGLLAAKDSINKLTTELDATRATVLAQSPEFDALKQQLAQIQNKVNQL
jgi:hypothetical protein